MFRTKSFHESKMFASGVLKHDPHIPQDSNRFAHRATNFYTSKNLPRPFQPLHRGSVSIASQIGVNIEKYRTFGADAGLKKSQIGQRIRRCVPAPKPANYSRCQKLTSILLGAGWRATSWPQAPGLAGVASWSDTDACRARLPQNGCFRPPKS